MKWPGSVTDITKEWATHALGVRYPGIEVTTLEVVDVVAATTTKVRLRLGYNDVGIRYGLPAVMLLKGGLAGLPHEMEVRRLYRNEGVFYRDVAPQLGVDVPRCFYADTDEFTSLILMEDLTVAGAAFGNGAKPLSVETTALALDYLAAVHARWWGDPDPGFRLMSFDEFFDWFRQQSWLEGVRDSVPSDRDPDASLVAQARTAVSDFPRFLEAVSIVHGYNRQGPQCLVHGDAHIGNMYFVDGAPRWLDWQIASRGNWAWDVSYFVICSLGIADRRAHERDLLAHYLDCLQRHGARETPTRDQAWLAYRRNAFWGISWALVPAQMQATAGANPVIERFATAFVDLQTMESLGMAAGRYAFML